MPDTPEDPDDGPDDDADDGGDLDAIIDELYTVRPDEFVPERDDAVARAREAGDRELARAIGKLRRPTRAAWLANLLARERPDQLEGLLGLAPGLADAQRTLDGSALRALSSQRHRLVAAVAAEAGRLAQARHEPVGDALLRDVQGILEAALADPAIADEVRSGRLTRTVSYSGFGPAADPGAVPAPPRREPRTTPEPPPEQPAADADETAARERAEQERRERERARREEALAEAEAAEAAAADRQHADEAARDDAVQAREAAQRRVAELAAELEAARTADRDAATAAREAEVTAKASARAAGQAATAAARARARLEELDP
ncbi:MAG TPA: hypothetical protein VNO83_15105 [Pseudonocardia sp.]|nr:hypothetical protein [Pseudonocardia sp.]